MGDCSTADGVKESCFLRGYNYRDNNKVKGWRIVWSEIILVISKSNEGVGQVGLEIK